MNYAIYDTHFGTVKIGYTDKFIIHLDLETHENTNNRGTTSKLSDLAYSQLTEYFEGQRKVFDFPYKMQGTDFQKKVWKALCEIPYGETRSYKDIAIVVGNPKASRAVGMANNRNRLLFVVPCHRVIGANGSLVGYAGGLEMKTTLLELERKYKDKL
jgi:methylated-DNA-[protein]-cysteine S-methyltransferase